MTISVLNGSPKGDASVTMQYVHFIQKKFPQHELKIINISQRLKTIERDEKAFQDVIDQVRSSDGVLWAFPLYVFLVHSNYKRLIELITDRAVEDVFRKKYTAVLTTSIHFFDHAAHNYMNAICDDLNMNYVGGFSADSFDLLKEEERKRLVLFAENFFEAIENKVPTSKRYQPVIYKKFDYVPGDGETKIAAGDKKIILLTDLENSQTNLVKMIERFRACFGNDIEVINLQDMDIKGGCLGCCQCGFENICAYGDKDEFMKFYDTKLKAADVLVFAGAIKDRYLSSKWKLFFDRAFFHCHSPSLIGKQIGFIISGPLSQIPNLRQILEGWTEWQRINLVDFITDEYEDSAEVDTLLQNLASRLVQFADKSYVKPRTFLGVGGMKIFRDDIWGRLRFPFVADHKFYKRHGVYDFPQKDFRTRIKNGIMMSLIKVPNIRKDIYTNSLKDGMIKPLQEILEEIN